MNAIVKSREGRGAMYADMPVPVCGPKDVLVKVRVCSICGSDLSIYDWKGFAPSRVKPPMIFGHEFAGDVIEIGSEVTSVKVGDYVSAETHFVCNQCIPCRMGQQHACQNTRILGVDLNGCYAEYVAVPECNVWINDPKIPPEIASIQEPLGNAVNTVMAAETRGRVVVVFGCGPIGLMAVGVAKACGAIVLAVDLSDYRLGIAKRMKADLTINPRTVDPADVILGATHGSGADVVLEMTGARAVYGTLLKSVRAGGVVNILGLPSEPVDINVCDDVVMRGVTVNGIIGRRLWDDWLTGRNLLSSGMLDLTPVVTHQFEMRDFEKGFELMRSGQCGKVVLYP